MQIVEGSKNRACSREIPPSFKLHFCANTGIVLSLSEYFGDFPLDKKEHNSFSLDKHQLWGNFSLCPLSQGVKSGFMRFNSSMAGSSLGFCCTNFPWIARSSILDLACLITVCKSDLPCSTWSIKANHFSISITIRCCSLRGGKGIKVFTIISFDILGCAPPPPFAINSFLWDNKK